MPDFYVFNFIPLVLLEAAALKLLNWGSLKRCLLDSSLMNGVTFLGLMLNLAPKISTAGPFGLLLFLVYSSMVEGVVLTLLERHQPEKIWSSVLVANAAGCVLLGAVSFYVTITQGAPPGMGPQQ